MAEFTLRINLGNACMTHPLHIANALRNVASKLEELESKKSHNGPIRDLNSNLVGRWKIEYSLCAECEGDPCRCCEVCRGLCRGH